MTFGYIEKGIYRTLTIRLLCASSLQGIYYLIRQIAPKTFRHDLRRHNLDQDPGMNVTSENLVGILAHRCDKRMVQYP